MKKGQAISKSVYNVKIVDRWMNMLGSKGQSRVKNKSSDDQ